MIRRRRSRRSRRRIRDEDDNDKRGGQGRGGAVIPFGAKRGSVPGRELTSRTLARGTYQHLGLQHEQRWCIVQPEPSAPSPHEPYL